MDTDDQNSSQQPDSEKGNRLQEGVRFTAKQKRKMRWATYIIDQGLCGRLGSYTDPMIAYGDLPDPIWDFVRFAAQGILDGEDFTLRAQYKGGHFNYSFSSDRGNESTHENDQEADK
jgi:hypothetical protein